MESSHDSKNISTFLYKEYTDSIDKRGQRLLMTKAHKSSHCWHFSVILSSANMFCSPDIFILLFLVESAWFYCFLRVECAPQRDVHDLNEELRQHGFKLLCSVDHFKASLTCSLCGITLHYQDKAKAVWLVKRHANENS